MRNKRGIILLMLWSFFGYSYAQCDSLVQINDTTVNEISSPEQLNFLDKNYSSKLGKLVRILMQTQDSAMLSNTVDKIGQLKTNDSYCFLFTHLRNLPGRSTATYSLSDLENKTSYQEPWAKCVQHIFMVDWI